MYVKIEYVEKYSNPSLRGLIIWLASGIWFAPLLPIMQIMLPLVPKVVESPIPEQLKLPIALALGPVPIILWSYFYPPGVTVIIVGGEWLWKRKRPITKPLERIMRRFYKAMIGFYKHQSNINSDLIKEDLRKSKGVDCRHLSPDMIHTQ